MLRRGGGGCKACVSGFVLLGLVRDLVLDQFVLNKVRLREQPERASIGDVTQTGPG